MKFVCLIAVICVALPCLAGERWEASDLNPVTFHQAPAQEPIVPANICLMCDVDPLALAELQACLKLPIIRNGIKEPAIVIRASAQLPPEGFTIKTLKNQVELTGNGAGVSWAIYEFLERYAGVRWYFPGDDGRYVPKLAKLVVPPVDLADAPVFRKRELWPATSNPSNGTGTNLAPTLHALRSGDSWPIKLQVHSPIWSGIDDYRVHRPEIFQLTQTGQRDYEMLCYSNPKTLETFLDNIDRKLKGDPTAVMGIQGDAITVSPNDEEISCWCDDCRKLVDYHAGQYGNSSRIVATFVAKLAREVEKRWPDKKIIYLPYWNYALAPDGIEFPPNVHVQLCGMPGQALYKEPEIFKSEQANIDKWFALTHKKIQNWLYICWPEDRTHAMFAYPHVLQKYYRENRDKTVGSFINGETDHFPRQSVTIYCWMKLLWNPEFNVDAAIDAWAKNLYGPAAPQMRELVQLQIDGWEKSRWPDAKMTGVNIYRYSYPKPMRDKMKTLLEQAKTRAAGDALVLRRIAYYAAPFAEFFQEGDDVEFTKRKPLIVHRAAEDPKIDGKLDDPAWKNAAGLPFVRATDRTIKEPKYPTTLRAVWSPKGVTFGFSMTDPTPKLLRTQRPGRDNSMLWWDDCVELLLDVTGKNEGHFYHFIVSAAGVIADARDDDFSFNPPGIRAAAATNDKGWSVELFLPFDDVPEALRPAPGKPATWFGNFTRHRMADSQDEKKTPGSTEEYQRLNTTYAGPTANLADFGPIEFSER
jgi:hypothetical protein